MGEIQVKPGLDIKSYKLFKQLIQYGAPMEQETAARNGLMSERGWVQTKSC